MEKTAQQKQHNNNNNTKNNPSPQQHRHNNNNKNKHYKKDSSVPKWDIEVTKRAIVLPETKSDLMNILEEVDPEELLMESLVAKSRALKNQALKTNTEEEEKIESEEGEFIIEGSKVRIDLSQTCPICDKPIREIMYALHDYDHDRLAHFDCVYKKVLTSVKEKLTNNRYLAYLGSGSFGIMDPGQANQKSKMLLIEKIHPGAPLEELLHGDENNIDEEL